MIRSSWQRPVAEDRKQRRWWLILAVIVIVGSYLVVKEWRQRYLVNQQIVELQKQVEAAKATSGDLKQSLDLVTSPYFVEAEARLKLGQQKEGEQAVVVPEPSSTVKAATVPTVPTTTDTWIKYFVK